MFKLGGLLKKLAAASPQGLFRLVMHDDPKIRSAFSRTFMHDNLSGVEDYNLSNIYKAISKPTMPLMPTSMWLEGRLAKELSDKLRPLLKNPQRLTHQSISRDRLPELDIVGQGDGVYYASPWLSTAKRLEKEKKHVGLPSDADLNPAPDLATYRMRLKDALNKRQSFARDISRRREVTNEGWHNKATHDSIVSDDKGFLKSFFRRLQPMNENSLSDKEKFRLWWERLALK